MKHTNPISKMSENLKRKNRRKCAANQFINTKKQEKRENYFRLEQTKDLRFNNAEENRDGKELEENTTAGTLSECGVCVRDVHMANLLYKV